MGAPLLFNLFCGINVERRAISSLLATLVCGLVFDVYAEIKVSVNQGQKISDSIEIVNKASFGKDDIARIPLPPGVWDVTLLEQNQSTHTPTIDGLVIWLTQFSQRRVSAMHILSVYPHNNKNWNPRRCNGELMSKDRGSDLSGFCHSLFPSSILTNYKSSTQDQVRKLLSNSGFSWRTQGTIFDASYETRGRFAVYSQLILPFDSIGVDQKVNFSNEEIYQLKDWWKSHRNSEAPKALVEWYETYSQAVFNALESNKTKDIKPISSALSSLWRNVIAKQKDDLPALFEPQLPTTLEPTETQSSRVDQLVASERTEKERLAAEALAAIREKEKIEKNLLASQERQKELEARLAEERERFARVNQAQDQAPNELDKLKQSVTLIKSAHALVIGNSDYSGSARLRNPKYDADAMAQKLQGMGFQVVTVQNANRARMLSTLTQFRRAAAGADVTLLFYAGHGVQIDGVNYMLPTDIDQSDVEQATLQGISLSTVVENFLPGKANLVFLDACRDNPLQRTSSRSLTKGLAPISVAQGTLISYATKDGQTAADGTGKHSPFTAALLEHIGDSKDIGVVLRYVREKVMKATRGQQQPWEYGSLTGGELILANIAPK